MNKDQRKYLTDWVTTGFKKEEDALKALKTREPSLNNYLIAASLDGSLELNDIDSIQEHVKKLVLSLGSEDAFVKVYSSSYRDSNRSLDGKHVVTLAADKIFKVPQAYLDAKAQWDAAHADIEHRLDVLRGTKDTVLLKVNIGSDKALEAIIAQADTLATLDLVNRQLTASATKGELAK